MVLVISHNNNIHLFLAGIDYHADGKIHETISYLIINPAENWIHINHIGTSLESSNNRYCRIQCIMHHAFVVHCEAHLLL